MAGQRIEVQPGANWRVFTLVLSTTFVQMPNLDNCLEAVIVAPFSNAENMLVSYVDTPSSADRAVFWPGRALSLPINNTNKIWAAAETSAANIEVWAILR